MYQLHISDDQQRRSRSQEPSTLKGWQKFMNAWPALLVLALGAFMLNGCSSPTAPRDIVPEAIDISMSGADAISQPVCVASGALGVEVGTIVIGTRDVPGSLAPDIVSISVAAIDESGVYLPDVPFFGPRLYASNGTQLGALAPNVSSQNFTFINLSYSIAPSDSGKLTVKVDLPADIPLGRTFRVGFPEKSSGLGMVATLDGRELRTRVKWGTFGRLWKVCS